MDEKRLREMGEFGNRVAETARELVGPMIERKAWASWSEADQIYEFTATAIHQLKQYKRELNQEIRDIGLSFDARSPSKGGLFRAPVTRKQLDVQKRQKQQPFRDLLANLDSILSYFELLRTEAKKAMKALDRDP